MNKYIISPTTTYNEDELLWETKVGYDDEEKTLIFIVCGKTWLESKSRAEAIMIFISNTVHQVI